MVPYWLRCRRGSADCSSSLNYSVVEESDADVARALDRAGIAESARTVDGAFAQSNLCPLKVMVSVLRFMVRKLVAVPFSVRVPSFTFVLPTSVAVPFTVKLVNVVRLARSAYPD